MPTRRQVILLIATLAGGTAAYTAGSFQRAASRYDEAVRNSDTLQKIRRSGF